MHPPATTRSRAVTEAQRVGRYLVLGLVGSGRLSRVYAAYDPRLDRRIALKEVGDGLNGRVRELAHHNAKAAAKLSHPNVATTHEVFEQDGRLFIAMEFVKGGSLRRWMAEHPAREDPQWLLEAVDLVLQVGRGMEAAHARGVVHGALSPENILVGEDARVRIADFGAGAEALESSQPSEALDHASYRAICQEVLGEQIDLPAEASLSAITGRLEGVRTEASGRRGSRAGRRVVATLLVTGLVYGGLGQWRAWDLGRQYDACVKGSQLEAEWNDDVRGRVWSALAESRFGGASDVEERVTAGIDAYTSAWAEERASACHAAFVEPSIETEELDARVWCLDEQLSQLGSLVSLLEVPNDTTATFAQVAVLDLPRSSTCLDAEVRPKVRGEALADVRVLIRRARALQATGQYGEGVDEARRALDVAENRGANVLAVEAAVLLAHLLNDDGKDTEAVEVAKFAFRKGVESRSWRSAASAAARVAGLRGVQGATKEALFWAELTDAAIELAEGGTTMVEAELAISRSTVLHKRQGAIDQAIQEAERAVALLDALVGSSHPRALSARLRLSEMYENSSTDERRALELISQVRLTSEEVLGRLHPDVALALDAEWWLRMQNGDLLRGKECALRSLAITEAAFDPEHPRLSVSYANLASTYGALGDWRGGLPYAQKILAPQEKRFGAGPELLGALTVVAEFHKRVGNVDEAKTLYARIERITNTHQLAPRDEISTYMALGRFEEEQGSLPRALEFFERGLRVANEALGPNSGSAAMMELNIGLAFYRHDDIENALLHLDRAWELETSAPTPRPMQLTYIHEHIGRCHDALGNHAAALERWIAAFEIRTKELGPEERRTREVVDLIRGLCDKNNYTPACEALP